MVIIMKIQIVIELNLPEEIDDVMQNEFITQFLLDATIQPRYFTFGNQPSGRPVYSSRDIYDGNWEYM